MYVSVHIQVRYKFHQKERKYFYLLKHLQYPVVLFDKVTPVGLEGYGSTTHLVFL